MGTIRAAPDGGAGGRPRPEPRTPGATVRICVIFNPAAGRRRARRRLRGFLDRWETRVTLRPTARPGHAAELAAAAADGGFDVVAAAGGDGTVHEVAAGLLTATDKSEAPGPAFGVVPIGSANDYAFSLAARFGPRPLDGGESDPVDVGRVRFSSADGESVNEPVRFVCCCGVGLTGEVTRRSREVRGLQGPLLYGLAAWRAAAALGPAADWTVAVDGGEAVTGPTRSFSALIGRREGGFLMAPAADPADGRFETVRVGGLSRWGLVRLLPALARTGPPAGHPFVTLGRCRSAAITSPAPLTVHADGELACVPADGVRRVELDLLPGRLRAFVCPPG